VEFLGIIINGCAFVEGESKNLKELKIGDMIGHNFVSEFTERQDHLVSIKAKTDGLIAVFPLNEFKYEVRKNPDPVSARKSHCADVQVDEANDRLLDGDALLQRARKGAESTTQADC
jgi:hypothetical protein